MCPDRLVRVRAGRGVGTAPRRSRLVEEGDPVRHRPAARNGRLNGIFSFFSGPSGTGRNSCPVLDPGGTGGRNKADAPCAPSRRSRSHEHAMAHGLTPARHDAGRRGGRTPCRGRDRFGGDLGPRRYDWARRRHPHSGVRAALAPAQGPGHRRGGARRNAGAVGKLPEGKAKPLPYPVEVVGGKGNTELPRTR